MKATFWSSIPPRRRKLVFWILGLLLFYAILGFLILPPIVRAVAVKQLSRQLDRDGWQRAFLEKQLQVKKWLSLRKSQRATTTPQSNHVDAGSAHGFGEETL